MAKEKSRTKVVVEKDAALVLKHMMNFHKQCHWRLKEALAGIQAAKYDFSALDLSCITASACFSCGWVRDPLPNENTHPNVSP